MALIQGLAGHLLGVGAVLVALAAGVVAVGALFDIRTVARREEAIARRLAATRAHGLGAGVSDIAPQKYRRLAATRFGRKLREGIVQAGLGVTFEHLVSRVLWSSILALLGGTLLFGNVLPGIVLAVGIVVGTRLWVDARAEKRVELMREQIPDALTAVSNGLSAGMSLQQSLEHAAEQIPEPLKDHFRQIADDVAGGVGLAEALDNLRVRVPLRELATVSTALVIQQRIGGNIREMLEQSSKSVREATELRLSLRAKTAQGRMSSKVVGLLPLVLTGLIMLVDPSYVSPFLHTPIGNVLLAGALIMMVVGFTLVRRVVEVEI